MAAPPRILDPMLCREMAERETAAPYDTWARNRRGQFLKTPPLYLARQRVIKRMRAEGLSYPEIAIACDCGISTAREACRRPDPARPNGEAI
jgi:hypothetical protein